MAVDADALKAIKETLKKQLSSDIEPSEGPYYFLYTKKKGWEILSSPTDFYKCNRDHSVLWRTIAVPLLADSFELDDESAEELKTYRYGMPRGRVAIDKDDVNKLNIWYGEMLGEMGKRDVYSSFGLAVHLMAGNVSWKFIEHEKMVLAHREGMLAKLFWMECRG